MEVKKFYATNLPAAMRDIRRALGPDAVILSTRALPSNTGIHLLDGRATVEVTAAKDLPSPVEMLPRGNPRDAYRESAVMTGLMATSNSASSKVFKKPNRSASLAPQKPSHLRTDTLADLLGEFRAIRDLLDASKKDKQQDGPNQQNNGGQGTAKPQIPIPAARRKNAAEGPMVESRADRLSPNHQVASPLKPQSAEVATGSALHNGLSQFSPNAMLPMRLVKKRLEEHGVDSIIIQRIVESMRPERGASSQSVARSEAQDESLGTYRDWVEVVQGFVPLPRRPNLQKPLKIALVGPTGVGKTTTLAKIASCSALHQNKKVALITLDTYRIAAADQLKTYARLLGVPIDVVGDPAQLQESFNRYSEMDEILIDTPGYSPVDRTGIARLAAVVQDHTDIETHLLLTCATRSMEMRRILRAFGPLRFDQLIFSKMDEAAALGDMTNTWIMGGYPVSYFTTGQRVPEDLEPAAVNSVCQRLLAPVE